MAAKSETDGLVFYVATDGSDRWSGKLAAPSPDKTEGPFATLTGARNAIRERRAADTLRQPVTVLVRGGKYYLDKTLFLTQEDSGTQDYPVTYMAYPSETPILSGGQVVTGWKPCRGKILQADLPGARGGQFKSRELFYNGKRQRRARYPKMDPQDPRNGGHLTTGEAVESQELEAFVYPPNVFPHRWVKPSEGEINVRANWWCNEIVPIKSVDEQNRIITLAYPILDPDVAPWFMKSRRLGPGFPFFVENLLEELTEPGEWCLDSEDGIIYYWPPDDRIESGEVVVPALKTLVAMRDVSWVTLRGLTFTETLGGDNYHRSELLGYGAMFPLQNRAYVGEALRMRGAEYCTIEHNHFDQVGGNAVYLEHHNQHNAICYNEVSYAGANGICLLGVKAQHPRLNRIEDNHIHHCGSINNYVAGVFLGLSDSNVIGHNSIHDMPHHGINLGANGFGRNIIEYNDIHHTCLENFDLGAINCWMDVPRHYVEAEAQRSGHVIRFNHLADTGGRGNTPDSGIGVYLDDFSSNCLVYGNIIERANTGVLVHCGRHNVIENNILIDCRNQIWITNAASYRQGNEPLIDYWVGNSFTRNICYCSVPDAAMVVFHVYHQEDQSIWNIALAQMDDNLYFHVGGSQYEMILHVGASLDSPIRSSFREWQRVGYDTHSAIADPLFVDPRRGDYQLQPDSPALKLGIAAIDVTRIGIRSEARCSMP